MKEGVQFWGPSQVYYEPRCPSFPETQYFSIFGREIHPEGLRDCSLLCLETLLGPPAAVNTQPSEQAPLQTMWPACPSLQLYRPFGRGPLPYGVGGEEWKLPRPRPSNASTVPQPSPWKWGMQRHCTRATPGNPLPLLQLHSSFHNHRD